MFRVIEDKPKGICKAYRCNCKTGVKKKFCNKHHARMQKEVNLVGYTFNSLKQNAKRRGKSFDLTLKEFKTFCNDTGYLDKKGRSPESASIDRINADEGYNINNIQVLTIRDNVLKQRNDEIIAPF